MGLFDSLFGSPGAKYSNEERQLSEFDIRRLVSQAHIRTIDNKSQERTIEQAIIARRHGDGKISLRQIYEVLNKLKNLGESKGGISPSDRDGVMRVFGEHFSS